jgi:hypothetical protein
MMVQNWLLSTETSYPERKVQITSQQNCQLGRGADVTSTPPLSKTTSTLSVLL